MQQKFQGGPSRHKRMVSLKFTTRTLQGYRSFEVNVRVTNLQCPESSQWLQYTDTAISGWTCALQTYSVLKVHNDSITKIQRKFQGGRSFYKLIYGVLKVHNTYTTRLQKFRCGFSRDKLAVS